MTRFAQQSYTFSAFYSKSCEGVFVL